MVYFSAVSGVTSKRRRGNSAMANWSSQHQTFLEGMAAEKDMAGGADSAEPGEGGVAHLFDCGVQCTYHRACGVSAA